MERPCVVISFVAGIQGWLWATTSATGGQRRSGRRGSHYVWPGALVSAQHRRPSSGVL